MRSFLVAWLLAWCGVCGAAAKDQALVISYGSYNSAPFALLVDDVIQGGLIFDIATEFARRLDRPPRFEQVPRKRIGESLISGMTDMYCGLNPAWVDEAPKLLWSPPLFTERDIFVSLKQRGSPITGFADLRGQRIGTILGYQYSNTMEKMFSENISVRDDAPRIDNNIERLENGWIDDVLDSDIVIYYNMKSRKWMDRFVPSVLVESEHSLYCALANKPELAKPEIAAAFAAMLQDGTMAAFLARYR